MLDEQIETLRAHVHGMAAREQGLLRSLSETLSSSEEKLLQHVREIAAQHAARRAEVLSELQGLAACLGKFPRIENDTAEDDGAIAASLLDDVATPPVAITAGDWRRAASIITQDESMVEILHARAR